MNSCLSIGLLTVVQRKKGVDVKNTYKDKDICNQQSKSEPNTPVDKKREHKENWHILYALRLYCCSLHTYSAYLGLQPLKFVKEQRKRTTRSTRKTVDVPVQREAQHTSLW